MNKKVIVANWKMNKTGKEAAEFISEFAPLIKGKDAFIGICPSHTAIEAAAVAAEGTNILIGAQNFNENDKGPYSGEISTAMLTAAGSKFSLVGHSERRALFGDTNEVVNKKLLKALQSGLIAILCVGENMQERTQGKTNDVITKQLTTALEGVYANEFKSIIIAYEPVWAISKGTGSLPQPTDKEIATVVALIRSVIENIFDKETATNVQVLFGGSVDDVNVAVVSKVKGVDGALVGGASLVAERFAKIVDGFTK